MPGKWITNQQVKIYMNARKEGNSQVISAAKSGISVKSGQAIDQQKRPDPREEKRHWRTRHDPLSTVWDSELAPMLGAAPSLQPITLLEHLQMQYPGQYEDKLLRTLQRRVKKWRATEGPEKEVMFRQQRPPGSQGLSDFTHLKGATITIAGQTFIHLLYHFRLAYSKWSYLKVIRGGESFTALAEGLQEALQRLGGSPHEHRTDSLSAAYKNLTQDEQTDSTGRYQDLCEHYSMKGTRNNTGVSHENGCVESAHGHLKRRVEQALLLRGNHDFESVTAYQQFIDEVVQQHNRRNAKAVTLERQHLQSLPTLSAVDYTEVRAVVTSSSTIDVRRVTYTVPSRLQGETLQVRLYDDRLCCYLGHQSVVTLNRVYPTGKSNRARQVDYRHVIHSLAKKPQAFRYSQIRDDLLPSDDYKTIWQHIDKSIAPRPACKLMVGLLHLAATEHCEQQLAQTLLALIAAEQPLSLSTLQSQFKRSMLSPPEILVEQHRLCHYDQYIPQQQEVSYV